MQSVAARQDQRARSVETPTTARRASNMVRLSGAAGVIAVLLLLVGAPLFIMMGAPPAVSDAATYAEYLTGINRLALTTKLINTVYVVGFILFITGIRELIRNRGANCEWAASLVFAGGLTSSIVILVGDVLGAAAALDTYSRPDATAIRALTEATLPAFGAIGLTMTALFLVPASWGLLAARTIPTWTGWMGYAVALLSLIAAGTIFGGNDFLNTTIWGGSTSAGLYSYAYLVAGLALQLWMIVVGICMFRLAR